jgi:aminoglycoside/choline kinase family phosphotransferase
MPDRRVADAAALRSRIQAYLDRTGLSRAKPRVVPLTGDASDRHYYRLLAAAGPPRVLALSAGPFDFARLPFANVARLLDRMPVPVPSILDHHDDLGLLALEDLGDVTLQAHLGATPGAGHEALYLEAIGIIATIQSRGVELESPEYLPYGIAFDEARLTWELEFFVKHFIEAYRGAAVTTGIREALGREWRWIVEELAAEPRVLCHRDYHSRNLMWHNGRLFVIDFQDARMGPDTYDLVSLLRDSYVDLPDDQVNRLIGEFRSLRGLGETDAEFERRFDLMALQRNLKALGTFGYQTTTRGNPVYLQYIPRTLRYVRANLERHARFGALREALAGLVDELR